MATYAKYADMYKNRTRSQDNRVRFYEIKVLIGNRELDDSLNNHFTK